MSGNTHRRPNTPHPGLTGWAGRMQQVVQTMHGRPLIIVTNRGPMEFLAQENGDYKTRAGAGGVVTAIVDCLRDLPDVELTWVAVAMTAGDRAAFAGTGRGRQVDLNGQAARLRYVTVPDEAYHLHYDVLSNEALWFLQHYLWTPAVDQPFTTRHEHAWENGYRVVNTALAEAVADEVRRSGAAHQRAPLVFVQDYQLYLVPGAVRQRLPRAILAHFTHIPWPGVRYWELLPYTYLTEIYQSLAHCDLLGFQTQVDVNNYLQAATDLLPGSTASLDRCEIRWGSHRVRVGAYPATIDAGDVRRSAAEAADRVATTPGRQQDVPAVKTIVRVDRLEPTKNIVRGFQAFERMLDEHPDLRGTVRLQAFLVPSREDIPTYQRYRALVQRTVRAINQRWRTEAWTPIEAVVGNNRPRALAAMREADVLLVNPIIDGMNLVAKEGVVVSKHDAVLVLSRTAGAFHELGSVSLPVSPMDVRETAGALYAALTMESGDRQRLAAGARTIVEEQSPAEWLLHQIADALDVRSHARERHSAAVRPKSARLESA